MRASGPPRHWVFEYSYPTMALIRRAILKGLIGKGFFRWPRVLLVGCLILPAISWAAGVDPNPPQVSVDFYYPPARLTQHGTQWLVYEMRLSSYPPVAYMLDSIDVAAGAKTFTFSGATLQSMMRFFGEKGPVPATRRIGPGQSAVVYFVLEFPKPADLPGTLQHTLHLTSADGSHHALTAEPLVVRRQPPVVIAPPLRGDDWLAFDSVHNGPDAAHRRTILIVGGQPWLAQRYAIDWVRYRIVDGMANTWSGPESLNSSYFCYDNPVYSVADGTVVEATDGIPENVPHSGKYAVNINLINAGGNHVVVDIGNNRYAFFAHMRPGTVAVKVGDRVKTGQILGHVGNSGSSTEPHLHMHIVDHPSFLAGHGVPYEFTSFSATGSPETLARPHDEMVFRNFGAFQRFHDDYPATNAAVQFP